MGREIRRVRPDWDHPTSDGLSYIPLHQNFPYNEAEIAEGLEDTPVFDTAEKLVNYLVENGEDGGDGPWRREAAEHFVREGFAFTFIAIKGAGLFGPKDQDLIR